MVEVGAGYKMTMTASSTSSSSGGRRCGVRYRVGAGDVEGRDAHYKISDVPGSRVRGAAGAAAAAGTGADAEAARCCCCCTPPLPPPPMAASSDANWSALASDRFWELRMWLSKCVSLSPPAPRLAKCCACISDKGAGGGGGAAPKPVKEPCDCPEDEELVSPLSELIEHSRLGEPNGSCG